MIRDAFITIACMAFIIACIAFVGTIGFINNTPDFYGEIIAKAVKAYNIEMSKP